MCLNRTGLLYVRQHLKFIHLLFARQRVGTRVRRTAIRNVSVHTLVHTARRSLLRVLHSPFFILDDFCSDAAAILATRGPASLVSMSTKSDAPITDKKRSSTDRTPRNHCHHPAGRLFKPDELKRLLRPEMSLRLRTHQGHLRLHLQYYNGSCH